MFYYHFNYYSLCSNLRRKQKVLSICGPYPFSYPIPLMLSVFSPPSLFPLIHVNTHTHLHAAAAAKSLQSCPTLCDPRDGSPLGSSVPGILQARTLEWVAISFSNAWKWKVKVKSLSCVQLLATPWTTAYQALRSMGFSRQEYWSGVPSLSLHLHADPSTCLSLSLFLFLVSLLSISSYALMCWN